MRVEHIRPPRRNHRSWTPAEDAILIANYPVLGLRHCVPLIPARSEMAISIRAHLLKLASPRTDPNRGGRRKGEQGDQGYIEDVRARAALLPPFLRGLEPMGDEANRLSNWAYVETVREHHPEREIW